MVPILVVAIAVALSCFGTRRRAQVRYFEVPNGAHPHDVAPAPDGTRLVYGAKSGCARDPRSEDRQSQHVCARVWCAPHGVIVGPDRAAWITEGGQNAIARFDPSSKAVKLFPLPREFPSANLNTATFDRKGILWFTGQNGVYGRVDPATGKVEAWKAPKGIWTLTGISDHAEW